MAKVDVDPSEGITTSNEISRDDIKVKEAAQRAIKKEKDIHEIKQEKRTELFRSILNNTCIQANLVRPIFTSLAPVIVVIILISVYALVPVHNLMKSPEKWFEYPLQSLICSWPIHVTHIIFDVAYFLNVELIRSFRAFGTMYVTVTIICWILFPSGYMIWTRLCGLQYPIPFIGYIGYFAITFTCLSCCWFQFPKPWRRNQLFRKRLKWTLFSILMMNLLLAVYLGLTAALVSMPKNYQWIIAIIFPFVKQANCWITIAMAKKCHDGDPAGGKVYIINVVNCAHSLYLTYSIGGVATQTTSFVIIFGKFTISVLTAIQLIYLKHKEASKENVMKQIGILQKIVISELTETLTPLTYLGCLTIAYYGDNYVLDKSIELQSKHLW